MTFLRSVIMAFSLFSAIPMPRVEWDEHNMRFMMAAFPAVGLTIGLCVLGWWKVCTVLSFGMLLRAAGVTLIPLTLTGGIHMDGYADVCDAQSSHAEPARRREILKDPHVGAFAVMGVCGYLMLYLALASELTPQDVLGLACVPVISRCLSGIATVTFKRASSEGMLAQEALTASKRKVLVILAVIFALTVMALVMWSPLTGAFMVAGALCTLVVVRSLAYQQYGGMGGDLAGFFLQVSELVMLACIVVFGRLV